MMKRFVVTLCLLFFFTNKIYLEPGKISDCMSAFNEGVIRALRTSMDRYQDRSYPPLRPSFRDVLHKVTDLISCFLLYVMEMRGGNLERLSEKDWRVLGILSVFFAFFVVWGKEIAIKRILIPLCPPKLVEFLVPISKYTLGIGAILFFIVTSYASFRSYNKGSY